MMNGSFRKLFDLLFAIANKKRKIVFRINEGNTNGHETKEIMFCSIIRRAF